MKVGDKKQVIVLTVVAVLAIGFLFSQLGGSLKASNAMPRLLAVMSGVAEVPATTAQAYPELVSRDAFSHPKLEIPVPKQVVKQPESQAPVATKSLPATELNRIPADPNWFETSPETAQVPAENTGSAEIKNEAPGISLKLLATIHASKWSAMVQLNSGDSVVVSQGQTLAERLRITKIGEDGITVRHNGKTIQVTVGEEAKL